MDLRSLGSLNEINQNSTNLEEIVREVLETRPGVVAARQPETLDRSEYARRSLPSSAKKFKTSHSRSRSLYNTPLDSIRLSTDNSTPNNYSSVTQSAVLNKPEDNNQDITITDIENENAVIDIEEEPTIKRDDQLRKSSALLRQRLAQHRKMTVVMKDRGVKASCWADLKYVKWPKIKSRLQVLLSQELWKGHIKEVEGNFGTAVVSYFVFLRWIFIMNIVTFLIWFSIICIPQIYYQVLNPSNFSSTSNIACLIDTVTGVNMTCSNNSLSRTGGIIERFSIPTNCRGISNVQQVVIRECSFNSSNIATIESDTVLYVSEVLYDSTCTEVNSNDQTVLANTTVYTVCVGVQALIPWYQHLLDFITGKGFINETLLFQGVYANVDIGTYDFSLAFLVTTGLVYAVAVFLLIYKMGQAFNENYVDFGTKRKVNFCNKLFTAWDFNITEPKTAKLRQVHIRTDLHEELLDLHAREKKRTPKQLALVIFVRIWTNLFVIVSLVASGAAIYYTAFYELRTSSTNTQIPFIGEYLSAIVISVLNAILPLVFQLVARLERYKTTTGPVKITLVRTVMVRLSSLVVLLASLFIVIADCAQQAVSMDTGACTINSFASNAFSSSFNLTQTCPSCWETFIGQQFYKLGVTNLFVSVTVTILVETGRHILSRVIVHIKWKDLGRRLGKFITKGNFNIPKSILDLIYTQTLLWLGFLFSPLLPFIVLITSFLLFYVKKYSLIFNLEPDKKGFQRSARTSFLFLLLMLLALFVSIIPVLYAVVQLQPSVTCGPFRGQSSMFESFALLINGASCPVQITIDFFTSAAFVVPLIVILILILYTLYVILKARDARFQLIKKQLILEGANVAHIVGNLNEALQQLAQTRSQEQVEYISQTIERRSRLLNTYSSTADTKL